jgi:hypothetical protein
MNLWILLGGPAAILAVALYRLSTRRSRQRAADQVSSDWLATAKIHEDQG